MQKETILENDYASVWYYPEEKIIHHKFHKFIFGEIFQKVMTKAADVFEEKGCKKWLSDDRKNWALRKEDIDWGELNWKPRVLKAGWKFWAVLMPDKVVGKMNMRTLIDEYQKEGVTVEIFDDIDEALNWLIKSN